MFQEITAENVIGYLQEKQHLNSEESASADALAWGVSNIVIRIHREFEADFVIKQSRTHPFKFLQRFFQLCFLLLAHGPPNPPPFQLPPATTQGFSVRL